MGLLSNKIIRQNNEENKFTSSTLKIITYSKKKENQHILPSTGFYYHQSLEAISKKKIKKIRLNPIKRLFLRKSEKLFIKGVNYLIKGRYNDAEDKLRKATKDDSCHPDILYTAALILNNNKEKLELLKRTLKDHGLFGQLFRKYSLFIQLKLNITPELGLILTNDKVGFYLLTGEIFQKAGKIEEAINILEKSNFLSQPEIKLSLGELYFTKGDYDQSIRYLQKINKDNAVGTNALLLLGISLRKKKLYKAAIDTLRRARRRVEMRPPGLILEARYQLGRTLEMDGKAYLARKEYEKILAQDYDYKDVKERWAKLNEEV